MAASAVPPDHRVQALRTNENPMIQGLKARSFSRPVGQSAIHHGSSLNDKTIHPILKTKTAGIAFLKTNNRRRARLPPPRVERAKECWGRSPPSSIKGESSDGVFRASFLIPKRVSRLCPKILILLPPCVFKGDARTAFRAEEVWAIEDLNL